MGPGVSEDWQHFVPRQSHPVHLHSATVQPLGRHLEGPYWATSGVAWLSPCFLRPASWSPCCSYPETLWEAWGNRLKGTGRRGVFWEEVKSAFWPDSEV